MISILIQAFISTFILAFMEDAIDNMGNSVEAIDFVVDVIYVCSIILKFRTAYYHQGELRTKTSDIVITYLKGSFVIDMLSELSLIGRMSPNSYQKYLILLTLLRILQIKSLIGAIEDHFQFDRQVKTLIELIKLCIAILILAHWFGCLLFVITKSEPEPTSWLAAADLLHKDIFDVYTASLYWAITTMSTVGYGDISPRTTRERILTIVIMIISSIVFGYLLSSIGSLLFELSSFSSESREKIRILNKYMKEKGLNKDIQSKIKKYLEYYLNKENTLLTEGDNIIRLLSQSLKEEIIKEVNAKILNDVEIFSSNFRKKFLYLISKDLVEKSFGPDDVIFTVTKNLNQILIY